MQRISFYDQIGRNKRNSFLLVLPIAAVVVALLYIIGYVFAPDFLVFIVIIGVVWMTLQAIVSYKYGDRAVLSVIKIDLVDD